MSDRLRPVAPPSPLPRRAAKAPPGSPGLSALLRSPRAGGPSGPVAGATGLQGSPSLCLHRDPLFRIRRGHPSSSDGRLRLATHSVASAASRQWLLRGRPVSGSSGVFLCLSDSPSDVPRHPTIASASPPREGLIGYGGFPHLTSPVQRVMLPLCGSLSDTGKPNNC